MKNITESITYTPNVRVVENLDDVDGPNSEATAQDLANRTAYLRSLVESSSPLTFERIIPLSRAIGAAWALSSAAHNIYEPAGQALGFTCSLPDGATLTRVRVGVNQGFSHAVMMGLSVFKHAIDADSSPSAGTSTQLGSTAFKGATGASILEVASLSEVFSADLHQLRVVINASGSGSGNDWVYWCEATFTHTSPIAGKMPL